MMFVQQNLWKFAARWSSGMIAGSGDASLPDFAVQGEMIAMPIELEVNGKRYPVHYDPDPPLLYVLRGELGLTGTKYGCGERQCVACTALIGRAPRRTCQISPPSPAAKPPTTVEGLEKS